MDFVWLKMAAASQRFNELRSEMLALAVAVSPRLMSVVSEMGERAPALSCQLELPPPPPIAPQEEPL
jgi:hypothetical protein